MCSEIFPGRVYPLLPFTHSMAALREAVGGCYGNDYWMDLAKLGIFLVIALFVGLVLRKPIIRMNEAFTEQLEETKYLSQEMRAELFYFCRSNVKENSAKIAV